jgi:hypothetical protein
MKKPLLFLILKIVGFFCLAIALLGIVLVINGFGDFETNNFMIGGFLTTFGLFIGISFSILGFRPEISKMAIQSQKYIQEENKEALKEISDTTAEINANAVKTIANAVAEGFSQNTVFCKECGEKIDSDSKFCRHCGTKQ